MLLGMVKVLGRFMKKMVIGELMQMYMVIT